MIQECSKRKASPEHLANWYFGNYCINCARIDCDSENYGKKCFEKINNIAKSKKPSEMHYKEFISIIKTSLFCKPIKRIFSECPICKKFGIK